MATQNVCLRRRGDLRVLCGHIIKLDEHLKSTDIIFCRWVSKRRRHYCNHFFSHVHGQESILGSLPLMLLLLREHDELNCSSMLSSGHVNTLVQSILFPCLSLVFLSVGLLKTPVSGKALQPISTHLKFE